MVCMVGHVLPLMILLMVKREIPVLVSALRNVRPSTLVFEPSLDCGGAGCSAGIPPTSHSNSLASLRVIVVKVSVKTTPFLCSAEGPIDSGGEAFRRDIQSMTH